MKAITATHLKMTHSKSKTPGDKYLKTRAIAVDFLNGRVGAMIVGSLVVCENGKSEKEHRILTALAPRRMACTAHNVRF